MLSFALFSVDALVVGPSRVSMRTLAPAVSTAPTVNMFFGLGKKKDEGGALAIASPASVVSAGTTAQPITEAEVRMAQASWASAIKTISKTYLDKGDFVGAAATAAGELYGYGHSNVLFKPTKAVEVQFRPMAADAMSYFVGNDAVEGGYKEDGGFAINGGKGWSDVVFDNHQIDLNGNSAIAMGTYYFTCATTGSKTMVEYTFGYKRSADGKVRIFLHHSSVPYAAGGSALTVSEEEVLAAQAAWASSIKTISAVYLKKGDYVQVLIDA